MNSTFEATAAFAPPIVPWFATRLIRLLRPIAAVPAESLDASTGLYNRAGLFAAANEIIRSRGPDVPVSAVVLEFTDLREVRDIYGAAITRKLVARVVRRLRAVAGLRGLVGRTGPAQFTIVFAGATLATAQRRLQRGLGRPARVEFDAGDSEIVLVPDIVMDAMDHGDSIQAFHREMARELARMRKDERRRLDWIALERERHSRPGSLRA